MTQHVRVTDYKPLWAKKYEEEVQIITGLLKDKVLASYHIGSTSVPGLAAKPIIDIMLVVRSLKEVDQDRKDLIKLGYEYLGEFGIKGRRYLRKGGDERTHQVHIFQADDWDNISRHLAFRDYMRDHEKERRDYAELKKDLAERFPYDIDSYCLGKEDFVRKIEKRALDRYDELWEKMYISARKVQKEWSLSSMVQAGPVAAAVLTKEGNIYLGLCIDTACSLGMCAERNALANMVTNGESEISRVLAIGRGGKALPPCGACREFMVQVMAEDYQSIEIMVDYEKKRVVKLKDLTPDWWL